MIQFRRSVPRRPTAGGWLVAALVALLTVAGAQAKVSERSLRYHEEARRYLEQGKVNEAIIQLKNAIRTDPDNLRARFDLGLIHLRRRAGPAAEKELKAARAGGMPAEQVIVPLARAYLQQRKFDQVLDEITPGEYPAAVNAGVYAARADALLGRRQPEEAAAALRQALEYADDNADIYVALSRVLQVQGKGREAEAALDRALGLDADNFEALLGKGNLRRRAGDLAAATDAFDRAVAANPGDFRARLGRAAVAIGQADDARAWVDVDAVLVKAPGQPIAVYLQSLLLARQGDYAGALGALQEVQTALAGHLPAVYLLGALSFAENQLEQALALIEQYRAAVPQDPRGHRLLASIHLRRKAPGRAVAVLEPVIERWPEDFRLLALLANAYMSARQYAQATELFERAVALAPDNIDVQTRLAASRLGAGEAEQAVKELEAIIGRDDPNTRRASVLLILTHLRDRDFDAALAATETLQARLPGSPVPDNFRGMIQLAKGDLAAARQGFRAALKVKPDYFPAILNLAGIDRREGDAAAARRRYQAVLEQDPKHLRTMVALAELDFAADQPAAAITWLEKAAVAHPRKVLPRLRLVNTHLGRGQAERALAVARELVQVAPKHGNALDALARAQLAVGQTASATVTYRQLVDLVPNSAKARHRLARLLAAADKLDEAGRLLDKAIALDPTLAAAWRDRFEVEVRARGVKPALALAQKMRPDAPPPLGDVMVADLLYRDQQYGPAAEAYAAGFAAAPSSALVRRLYQSHARAGDADRGRALLRQWLAEHDADNEVRFVLAGDLIGAGEYPQAIAENETLLARLPDNAVVLNNLAWLYDQQGDDRALGYARRAHQINPDAPEIADTLGWLLVNRGELTRGLELLRQANATAPERAEIGYHLAAALHRSGDDATARALLETALGSGTAFSGATEAQALLRRLSE